MTDSQQSDETVATSEEKAATMQDAPTHESVVQESVVQESVAQESAVPDAAEAEAGVQDAVSEIPAQDAQAPNGSPEDAQAPNGSPEDAQAPNGSAQDAQAPNGSAEDAPGRDSVPTPSQEAADAPTPSPANAARPVPPRAPTPAAFASRPKGPGAPAGPTAVPATPAAAAKAPVDLAQAAKFGRAEADGHVFLLLDGEEHPVGQYPGATPEEALSYFVRKFDDIVAQVALLEQRVEAKAAPTDMRKTVKHLRSQLAERNAVGDVHAAEGRLSALEEKIKALEATERAAHEAARANELAAREALVAEAEEIAAQDPALVQWKTSSARMNELFEAWKTAQKTGLRLGRSTEESLWKRFRSARTVFDRHRRAHFSALDNNNAAAKAAKEALIQEAEALSDSTEWGHAAGEYRRLMDQWKSSPRASRKDDDALWARFRAAQDKFFSARQAANAALDQEFGANLVVKEALIAEAQQLLPIKDLAAAKRALQSIRDRWEAAGKVPRADMQRVEAGLRNVEDAVRSAEDEDWRRSDPEAKARTTSMLSQLESTIASLKEDLAAAEAAGDSRKIRDASEALAAREQWLEQVRKAASDLA